jgi:CRISPR-associated protein Cmr1
MQTIEASFEIVTPMFIGGGTPEEVDLRPPSIKGALRFWWRALQWGQCLQESEQNQSEALKLLHELEAELFGAAVKDEKYGQGLFMIKIKKIENKGIESAWPRNNKDDAAYLGYGLDKTKDAPHRQAIPPTQFSLCLGLKKQITDIQKQQLKQSLMFWGFLGGLGSRARRGFGSVSLTKLDEQDFTFENQEAYSKAINDLLGKIVLAPNMPIFTALNKGMQIAIAHRDSTYKKVMDNIGREYKDKRKSVDALKRVVFGLPLEGEREIR